MHSLAHILFIYLTYKYADWKNWKKYHATLLYIGFLNLTYNFLAANYDLWRYEPDLYSTHSITEILNSVIALPAIAFIFLSNYPAQESKRHITTYYIKWIVGSLIIESIYIYFDKITFHNGYKFWMEPFFYILMYVFIRLHFMRPLLTYFLSAIVIILFIVVFNVPVGTSIGDR